MNVIWSLEKVEGRDWQQQAVLLEQSVLSWKHHYPEDYCMVYLDDFSRDSLGSMGILQLFDAHYILNYADYSSINPQVFWASSKLRAIREQQVEFVFLDNDFLLKGPIKSILDPDKICYNHTEDPEGLYPTLLDPEIRNLPLSFRLYQISANTSFLYFPDVKFSQEYASISLSFMDILSKRGVVRPYYMIFAEQMLFRNLILHFKKEYQCLCTRILEAYTGLWLEDRREPNGLLTSSEESLYFEHMGFKKMQC